MWFSDVWNVTGKNSWAFIWLPLQSPGRSALSPVDIAVVQAQACCRADPHRMTQYGHFPPSAYAIKLHWKDHKSIPCYINKNRAVKTFWTFIFIIKNHLNTDFSQICLSPNRKKALLFSFFLSTLIQKQRMMGGEGGVEKKWGKLPRKKSKNSDLKSLWKSQLIKLFIF